MRIFSISNRVAALRSRVSDTFTLPERFKGTIVEKWAAYWRGLLADYSEVTLGVLKEAKEKPMKALKIGGIGYAGYMCAKRNPDELALLRQLRDYNNQMTLVPAELHNPITTKYLKSLETAVNQNTLRTFSLGLCTIVWIDLYDNDDCTYPAICEYTKVGYWNFYERIVDIGFWNRFWHLDYKMINYDVNYL